MSGAQIKLVEAALMLTLGPAVFLLINWGHITEFEWGAITGVTVLKLNDALITWNNKRWPS